jgi:outer membrane protein insertion porin family
MTPACHEELGIGEVATEDRREISGVELVGVNQLEESAVKRVMRTKPGSWLPWSDPQYFDRREFENDLDRIESFYRQEGFPDAHVDSFDVNPDADTQKVSVSVSISEGEPLIVSAVELQGVDSEPAAVVESLRQSLPLEEGRRLTASAEAASAALVARALQERGHPEPEVSTERVEEAPRRVRVIVRAQPGPVATFGPVEIAGNSRVSDNVVRRQLTYQPGELFARSALANSHRQLTALNLFDFVSIDTVTAGTPGDTVTTRVTVAEGKPRRLNFSFGYGTEEKAAADATWDHLNFLGGARTFGVRGKWSAVDRGVDAHFTQPYVFRSDLALSLRLLNWYADEPAFRATTRGGRGSLAWTPASTFSTTATYIQEFQSSRVSEQALDDPRLRDELIALGLNPITGQQSGTLAAVRLDVERRTTIDLLNPRRGYLLLGSVERAGHWAAGAFNYLNLVGEARGYHTIGERLTFAARARAGSIAPRASSADVPFSKRYFLGGSTSLRGWGRFEVAPLSDTGVPLGGNSMFEATGEVRLPLAEKLGGVLFVDAGNVWLGKWDVALGDLLWDAGSGLRYETPFGPLRFDVGYQLTPLEGLRVDGVARQRRWRVHFSIGQAF